jgi:hypothetical protein
MMVVLAAAATIVWSILDQKRANYRTFHAWLRIWVRYTLAMTMFGYGFAKVFPLQFSPPSLIRLLEPLNEFSPMGVLWTFMGASAAYTIFAGSAEVLGGLLLIPRRTTALGALVTAGVMTNVVLLNFCYDVPVKLYSSNLLLMAIFLAAPECRRLFDLFVMNRATRPSRVDDPLFRSRNMRRAAIALKSVLFAYVLYGQIKGGAESYRRFYTNAPKSPLYGIWNVARIEGAHWNKVVMERPQAMSIRRDDGAPTGFQTTFDEAHHRITLTNAGYLDYTRSGEDALHMEGVVQNQRLSMDLTRVDLSKFLLTNRGFHWINERPFNR